MWYYNFLEDSLPAHGLVIEGLYHLWWIPPAPNPRPLQQKLLFGCDWMRRGGVCKLMGQEDVAELPAGGFWLFLCFWRTRSLELGKEFTIFRRWSLEFKLKNLKKKKKSFAKELGSSPWHFDLSMIDIVWIYGFLFTWASLKLKH